MCEYVFKDSIGGAILITASNPKEAKEKFYKEGYDQPLDGKIVTIYKRHTIRGMIKGLRAIIRDEEIGILPDDLPDCFDELSKMW